MTQNNKKVLLEYYYSKYNRPELISPDPLQFVYEYPDHMETAGFIASCFALGRVNSIISALKLIFSRMPDLTNYIVSHKFKDFYITFKDFKYRFFSAEHIAFFLSGIGRILNQHGTLENLFCSASGNIIDKQKNFIAEIRKASDNRTGILLADPGKGSACKRLNLFLRWMVRKDTVDPGVWNKIKPEELLVPVDTHMHNIGRILEFTSRKAADLKTVLEITEKFKGINPRDPVKYDFALTRMGIHPDFK